MERIPRLSDSERNLFVQAKGAWHKCKACNKLFGTPEIVDGRLDLRKSRCINCGADLFGKRSATPKRTTPREIKTIQIQESSEITSILKKIMEDNSKVVDDCCHNPKAIGRLIGAAKKQLPNVSGQELGLRFEDLLKEIR